MITKLRIFIAGLVLALFLPLAISTSSSSATGVDVFSPVCKGVTNANTTDVCKSVPASGTPGTNPVIAAIKVTITIMSIVIGVTAVIMIIVSGFTLITSGGDPQAVAKARNSIIYALVGIVVAVLAETIVVFVLSRL
jgi:hypothetical protein